MFNMGTKKKVLKVDGMTCHHCEMTVEKALLEIDGVKAAKADHTSKSVEVQYKDELDLGKVKDKVEKVGYKFVSANRII
ncbi:MAG: cation transporter [Bacteroidetes bacterium]|nr:cation transporter [Bacteroidota bacterium]